MKEIETLRNQIDVIDDELVELFEKRMELVTKIGYIKECNFMRITDLDREEEVIKRGVSKLKNKDFSREIRAFLEYIIALSKSIQKKDF